MRRSRGVELDRREAEERDVGRLALNHSADREVAGVRRLDRCVQRRESRHRSARQGKTSALRRPPRREHPVAVHGARPKVVEDVGSGPAVVFNVIASVETSFSTSSPAVAMRRCHPEPFADRDLERRALAHFPPASEVSNVKKSRQVTEFVSGRRRHVVVVPDCVQADVVPPAHVLRSRGELVLMRRDRDRRPHRVPACAGAPISIAIATSSTVSASTVDLRMVMSLPPGCG